MWGSKPKKQDEPPPDSDPTTSFLSSLQTPREIRKPIEVQERDKKEKSRTADEFEIVYNPETDADHPYENWRRNRILKCLISREIARYLDRKTFITVSVREALLYVIFLVLLTIITFGSTPLDMFYFSQAMASLYTKQKFEGGDLLPITFYEINTMADVWEYLQDAAQNRLFNEFWYFKPDPYESTDSHEEQVFYENKMIGMPQLRSVRIKPNATCFVHPSMKHICKDCYGPYEIAYEETDDFSKKNQDRFVYTPANITKSMHIDGTLATYGGGGYVKVLDKYGSELTSTPIQAILALKNALWMDKITRAIFLEFTVYNGNVNLFCIFKLIFEFPPTGGVIPSHWNYVQKLIRYNDGYDYFVLGCEILFIIFFIFYTIQKLLEIKTLKMKLFYSFWNWIDIIILVMSYLVVIFDILLYVVVNSQLPDMVKDKNKSKYVSFDEMCFIHILYSYSFAVLIAVAFFRLLKYLNIVHAMYQLQSTISRATPHILTYCIMFFYIYFVFALIGLFLFGNKMVKNCYAHGHLTTASCIKNIVKGKEVIAIALDEGPVLSDLLEDYKTFPMAVFALMRSSVGDFNYHKLVQADPICGPIFFFAFIFFIAFILVSHILNGILAWDHSLLVVDILLLQKKAVRNIAEVGPLTHCKPLFIEHHILTVNVFLAILVSKYEEVRSEVRIGGVKTFIGDMIKYWLLRVLEKAECNWLLSQIERRRFEKKIRSPTEAIRQYLRQAGYSELEIELFFKKYDITDSKISAMDEDRLSFRQGEREAPPPLSQKDILRYIVIQKLEYLENHYQAANKLIDEFLSKLNKFEARR